MIIQGLDRFGNICSPSLHLNSISGRDEHATVQWEVKLKKFEEMHV